MLPRALPRDRDARLLLFALRRLGAHGLDDAHAANAFVSAFGEGFRRPLVLIRALMQELAAAATAPIAIAPCCCQRMTPSENVLLTILARAEAESEVANLLLADLPGVRRADGILATAATLAAAFADAGRPIIV